MIKGQTDRDSIIFHGNITNDMKEEEDIVKLYRYNLFCKNNELTVSVDSAMDKHGRRPAAVYVKLTKDGRAAGESVFPLSGNCPIEEDIGVEVSDKGFIIRIPYCDGHMSVSYTHLTLPTIA